MARIICCYRQDWGRNREPVMTYGHSFAMDLRKLGHEVLDCGEGWPCKDLGDMSVATMQSFDLLIDLDCGRDTSGNLHFRGADKHLPIKRAIRFIDTHGYPTLHHRMAAKYHHVFFAVWDKRDRFAGHPSAHWCPNASDSRWFDYRNHLNEYHKPESIVGFYGSKGGLDRADPLVSICRRNNYPYDIRQIGRTHEHKWPHTAEAMAKCSILFNKGQKHDGPNQRVLESMFMGRPLITDRDKRDGMNKLFQEGEHFLGWEREPELANQITWCLTEKDLAKSMAMKAYAEVKANHQVMNRVQQILEVCLG